MSAASVRSADSAFQPVPIVERVARSIARTRFERKEWKGYGPKSESVRFLVNAYWRQYVPDAVEAIKAMRHATPEMEDAYNRECDRACLGESLDADRAWQIMCDAAAGIFQYPAVNVRGIAYRIEAAIVVQGNWLGWEPFDPAGLGGSLASDVVSGREFECGGRICRGVPAEGSLCPVS